MTSRSVAIIGSTGSIGTQGLDVIGRHPGRFDVVALAGGANLDLLARQAAAVRPALVGAATGSVDDLRTAIAGYAAAAGHPAYAPEVVVGERAAEIVAGCAADVVLNGIT